jgi:hypothetical protein
MSFDPVRAVAMVRLARIAYRDPVTARRDVEAAGYGGFVFFDGHSTQGFLVTDDAGSHFAFRGTESRNPVDWARDGQFHPSAGEPLGRVHSGFRLALGEVWDDVEAELGSRPGPLFVTGHSLGAGLAVLAAARLAAAGRVADGVYLFGSPRPGLRDFRSGFDEHLGSVTFNVINHIDLVTRVPLLVQGYRHVGRRMYFDADRQFHPDAGAWHIAKDDLRYRLTHFGRIESIGLGPHSIGRYVERVESM